MADQQKTAEVLAHLVAATVFKTVGTQVKPAFSGFDSHALPPLNFAMRRNASHGAVWLCNYRGLVHVGGFRSVCHILAPRRTVSHRFALKLWGF